MGYVPGLTIVLEKNICENRDNVVYNLINYILAWGIVWKERRTMKKIILLVMAMMLLTGCGQENA